MSKQLAVGMQDSDLCKHIRCLKKSWSATFADKNDKGHALRELSGVAWLASGPAKVKKCENDAVGVFNLPVDLAAAEQLKTDHRFVALIPVGCHAIMWINNFDHYVCAY